MDFALFKYSSLLNASYASISPVIAREFHETIILSSILGLVLLSFISIILDSHIFFLDNKSDFDKLFDFNQSASKLFLLGSKRYLSFSHGLLISML